MKYRIQSENARIVGERLSNEESNSHSLAPLGSVEPHAELLAMPPSDQALYKITALEHLEISIEQGYIHFNRIDMYQEFAGADEHDGEQLPLDLEQSKLATFAKDPGFTLAEYYRRSRGRTYASCFSLENTDYIWTAYGKQRHFGNACVEFQFQPLREMVNELMQPENSTLMLGSARIRPIFSVNYGIVKYVDWASHRRETNRMPVPVEYAYIKDKCYAEESEFRITLSALGMGHFALADGNIMEFPQSLHLGFDFRQAVDRGAIQRIHCMNQGEAKRIRSLLDIVEVAVRGC